MKWIISFLVWPYGRGILLLKFCHPCSYRLPKIKKKWYVTIKRSRAKMSENFWETEIFKCPKKIQNCQKISLGSLPRGCNSIKGPPIFKGPPGYTSSGSLPRMLLMLPWVHPSFWLHLEPWIHQVKEFHLHFHQVYQINQPSYRQR